VEAQLQGKARVVVLAVHPTVALKVMWHGVSTVLFHQPVVVFWDT
jgi:hypothetical protein